MDFRRLRYFLTVAEFGHITRAAEALGIRQPPLSQQIRLLEEEVGVALLQRHPKGVRLTEAGRLLEREAARLLADLEAVRARMSAFVRGEQGLLRVGFTSSAATHALTPDTLRIVRHRYPELSLEVREDNAAGVTESVRDGRLNCGFIRVPVSRPEALTFEELLDEGAVVAIPVDHPLARQPARAVSLRQLDGEALVLVRQPGAPGLYANLLAMCEREGVRVRIAAEVERMMTNVNLVAAGAGLSVLPASMRGVHAGAVVYRRLASSPPLRAPLTMVFRAGDCAGPTATFMNVAREVARRHRKGRR
jgi:DNA-binding transcriptional LysR family regulator